ncbi:hypothetical protein Hanom_Chr09g00770641 [Helianthus anomalus]
MSNLSNNVILRKRLGTNVLPKVVKSRKPVKFDVECTPGKRMASQLKTTEDKGKVISDIKETVKNTKKVSMPPYVSTHLMILHVLDLLIRSRYV